MLPKPSLPGRRRFLRFCSASTSASRVPARAVIKVSLRLVQARKGPSSTLQDIMAEALNDLFAKYDVPAVRQD